MLYWPWLCWFTIKVAFANKRNVVGYDISSQRIESLKLGYDSTNEVDKENRVIRSVELNKRSDNLDACNCYTYSANTIDDNKQPDLGPLKAASLLVAGKLKKGDIVIYESTVYPGATENDCVPYWKITQAYSLTKTFFVGIVQRELTLVIKSIKFIP